jgi:broad specificity phosphatase PhoE
MASLAAKFRIRLLIVRHGESQMNLSAHLLGGQHNHIALTVRGQSQATLLGQRLKFDRVKLDKVYTSTATRAKLTAEIALKHMYTGSPPASPRHLPTHPSSRSRTPPPIEHTPALLEQSQGEWEGRHRSEVYTPEVHEAMKRETMDFHAPGGESLRGVQKRAMAFLQQELVHWKSVSASEHREVVLAVVCHGGCIRALLQGFCGFDERYAWMIHQENTAVNELVLDHRGTSTIRVNDTAHLRYTMQAPVIHSDTAEVLEKQAKEAAATVGPNVVTAVVAQQTEETVVTKNVIGAAAAPVAAAGKL